MRLALLLLLMFMTSPIAFAQIDPLPLPDDITDDINDAASELNDLPSSVQDQVQLPYSPDPALLFSYVKYLFSYEAAQELLGARMAWAGLALFHYLTIVMVFTSIYAAVSLVVTLIKFIKWIFSLALKLFSMVLSLVSAGIGAAT